MPIIKNYHHLSDNFAVQPPCPGSMSPLNAWNGFLSEDFTTSISGAGTIEDDTLACLLRLKEKYFRFL